MTCTYCCYSFVAPQWNCPGYRGFPLCATTTSPLTSPTTERTAGPATEWKKSVINISTILTHKQGISTFKRVYKNVLSIFINVCTDVAYSTWTVAVCTYILLTKGNRKWNLIWLICVMFFGTWCNSTWRPFSIRWVTTKPADAQERKC